MFQDTKGAVRVIRRQHNGQMKTDKKTNIGKQNTTDQLQIEPQKSHKTDVLRKVK